MILALVLVILILITRVVTSVSTAKATNQIWELWSNVAPSSSMRQLRAKRDELMKVRAERSNTSSQDEFAKWARLDRQHLKLKKEYDEMNAMVMKKRQNVTYLIRALKFLISKLLMWGLMWHYRKLPVVWLPHNALPKRVEKLLCLPFAPTGSVSVANWVYSVDATLKAGTKLYKGFSAINSGTNKAQ